ncbi:MULTISPECIES: hypothetical protein [Ramlibacter]|uniref:Uncharacterized protein n=1 Tax=Ramlibacter pinisoli TaxID=2682844 RepID=A0A6N8IRR2_9BURK|nr:MULTISPECIES: hypothetical protein [Ramlibacter]MBA2964279.1 hypothetical protein [Ramlibacter sp. CGMCC 1.13660]MVQ29245.1 hypothetical protein [Ramlibacter pinisoli]
MSQQESTDGRSELALRLASATSRWRDLRDLRAGMRTRIEFASAMRSAGPSLSRAFALFRTPLGWWHPARPSAPQAARLAAHAPADLHARPPAPLAAATPAPGCGRSGHGSASVMVFLVRDRDSSIHDA